MMKKIFVIIAVCIVVAVAVVGVVLAVHWRNENKMKQEEEHKLLLVEEAIEEVLQGIEAGEVKKITFDEETKLAMEQYGIESFFNETEIREAIAKKFCEIHSNDDLDGLLEFLCFLNAHYSYLISKGNVYDICFSETYLEELKDSVKACGAFDRNDGANEVYVYNDTEIWLIPRGCYIKLEYSLNGEAKSGLVIIGDIIHRKDQHQTYDESSPGYFLVGEAVELVEDKIENSEDLANKYYPAATCPQCGTRFRANTMRARNIAERGYCGMGLCGRD